MRNYRNYQLKNAILKSLLEHSYTVKSIFDSIQYKGDKDDLFSEMNELFKHGYVKRHKNSQRLYEYSLTKKGIQHANNPFLKKYPYPVKLNKEIIINPVAWISGNQPEESMRLIGKIIKPIPSHLPCSGAESCATAKT